MYRLKSNQIFEDLKPLASVFDEFLSEGLTGVFNAAFVQESPRVNIIEEKDAYQIDLAAPGHSKADFNITTEGSSLLISISEEKEQESSGKDFTHREFSASSFSKSFHLTDDIDRTGIKATYQNGILHVKLPKKTVEAEHDEHVIEIK